MMYSSKDFMVSTYNPRTKSRADVRYFDNIYNARRYACKHIRGDGIEYSVSIYKKRAKDGYYTLNCSVWYDSNFGFLSGNDRGTSRISPLNGKTIGKLV